MTDTLLARDLDVDLDLGTWTPVCLLDDLLVERGACVLVDGRQVALFRLGDGSVHALSNYDPFSEAFVIARGIVGDRGGCPKIASPIYKQNFDLRTGACLDDASVTLPTYPVRVHAGRIQVGVEVASPRIASDASLSASG